MTKLFNITLLCLFTAGCVSQIVPFKQHIKSWVGQPITGFIEAGKLGNVNRSDYKGTERTMKLESGNLLYEFPYPKCPVFFEVDSKGIIVDITTEGDKDCY
ncbi:MAG: hypothetical protein WBC60_14245 [Cognaticolwellia sp.]